MLLVIDNYDSFTYNLVQYFEMLGQEVHVHRNDKLSLKDIEKKVSWLSAWMIHNANNIRPSLDGIKVGGHQASSASIISIMVALYFKILKSEDRVAVKPHAAPVFHSIQYLLGNQNQDKLENFSSKFGADFYRLPYNLSLIHI